MIRQRPSTGSWSPYMGLLLYTGVYGAGSLLRVYGDDIRAYGILTKLQSTNLSEETVLASAGT